MTTKTVLLTGAAGSIGTCLRRAWGDRYTLRLLDRQAIPDAPDAILTDLQDPTLLRQALDGVETLVHLAATPTEAPFVENLVPNNVTGVYHLFEAARQAGVRRIVFASTCQTVTAYPSDHTVKETDPPNPLSVYGATKYLGEILGRFYFDRYGMEFLAVRIGWFIGDIAREQEILRSNLDGRNLWLSHSDCADFFTRALDTPSIGYAVVFATSITEREWLSRQGAREVLGYEPRSDVSTYAG